MATYLILKRETTKPETHEPVKGRWYAGINEAGQVGQVAQWDGVKFTNSFDLGDGLDMTQYQYLKERT